PCPANMSRVAIVFIYCLLSVRTCTPAIGSPAGGKAAARPWQCAGEKWQQNGFCGGLPLRRRRSGIVFASAIPGRRTMARRIAIVEDDAAIRENYADVLRRQGYEVATYADRPRALAAIPGRLPDLALIDIGLADEAAGGFALCRELRAASPRLPIIFLTARDGDLDTVSGLRMGADDYLTKDISLPHLLARIA